MSNPCIQLWHGSPSASGWDGAPKILEDRKRVTNTHGAGIYFTTSPRTARAYAREAGVCVLAELAPGLVFLQDRTLPLETMLEVLDLLDGIDGITDKTKLANHLKTAAVEKGLDELPAQDLLFLCGGQFKNGGDAFLAEWFVSQGIHASIMEKWAAENDDWLVLFDTSKIIGWDNKSKEDALSIGGFPSVRGQSFQQAVSQEHDAPSSDALPQSHEFFQAIDSRRQTPASVSSASDDPAIGIDGLSGRLKNQHAERAGALSLHETIGKPSNKQ